MALAVAARFVLEIRVGPRTLAMARELLAGVAAHCRRGAPLLLEADEHRPYPQAILDIFGQTRFRRRKRGRGRHKHPDSKPPPNLMVGIVHKVRDCVGRLVGVKTKQLCGRRKDIQRCLRRNHAGNQINTAHAERLNGTLRTQQTRLARRTRNRSVTEEHLQSSLWLWRDLYHWTRPHASLSAATPAMALNLANRIWSVSEYVRFPVHVSDLQRMLWEERREKLLTTGLYHQKHRTPLPTS